MLPNRELAGGPIELAGLICALALCMMVRNRRPAMPLTCLATLFFTAALAMWFLYVDPANAPFAHWTAASLPPDWMRTRDQWEHTRAFDFGLMFIGLTMLLVSILAETPSEVAPRKR